MSDPPPLPTPLMPLRERPARAAILSDLDGTLAPIVARPADVALLPGAREALNALRERFALVGLVSGRALADLERIAGVPGLAGAGNHGMELRQPGGEAELAPQVQAHLGAVRAFGARLEPATLAVHGVSLEDKGPSLSLHYRTAADPDAARAFLQREVAAVARAAGLVTTEGRMVLEVRPPARVDKGTAVRALLGAPGAAGVRAACYLGDDRTDADAWAALRALADEGRLDHAVAVMVESAEAPAGLRARADVAVSGPEGALALLRALDPGPAAGERG